MEELCQEYRNTKAKNVEVKIACSITLEYYKKTLDKENLKCSELSDWQSLA